MSAQRVADAVNELGLPYTRSQVVNLENRRRDAVNVGEVVAFSAVLGVPPLLLLLPVGHEPEVEVLPNETRPTWDVARWFTGEASLGSDDKQAWLEASAPLRLRRLQEQLLAERREAVYRRFEFQRAVASATHEREEHRDLERAAAEAEGRTIRLLDAAIERCRNDMQQLGLDPGPAPESFAHLDVGRNEEQT